MIEKSAADAPSTRSNDNGIAHDRTAADAGQSAAGPVSSVYVEPPSQPRDGNAAEGEPGGPAQAPVKSLVADECRTVRSGRSPSPREDRPGTRMRRVFVSYAWDDAGHVAMVQDFVLFLRDQRHLKVVVDLEAAAEPQIWPQWTQHQILVADFILVVASPAYRHRADHSGPLAPREGRGVRWENRLIQNLCYEEPEVSTAKVLPVVLPGRSATELPFYLGTAARTHYIVTAFSPLGASSLLSYLSRPARLDTGRCVSASPHDRKRR